MYIQYVTMCMLLLTSVVKNVLSDVLNLLKGKLVFCPPARVPVYSQHWPCFEKAGLDVLKPLHADGVDEEEGMLTNAVTLVVKKSVCNLPLFRAITVVTLEQR